MTGGSADTSTSLPINHANHAARQASSGFGCTIFTTSASDGALPTLALSSCFSLAFSSHCCTSFFGRDPSDLRPTAPLRTICTNMRSILPLSTTRPNTCASNATSRTASVAASSAGMSFMWPDWRAYTAVFATNAGSTCAASASTASSCASALAWNVWPRQPVAASCASWWRGV